MSRLQATGRPLSLAVIAPLLAAFLGAHSSALPFPNPATDRPPREHAKPARAKPVQVEPAPAKPEERGPLPAQGERWDPAHTWVLVVSSTVWKYWPEGKMPKKGRQDQELVDVLKSRGVPDQQIVFLKDKAATLANIKRELLAMLSRTQPEDTFLFYFQGHGTREIKNGNSDFYFLNYDCRVDDDDSYLHVDYLFDSIENEFHGSRILLLADCCCSGGLAMVAGRRPLTKRYACLNSTFAHDASTGNWTYTDAVIRGFRGDACVDLDTNSQIALSELATYTEERMAFMEEQKAVFATFNGFNPKFELGPSNPAPALPPNRFIEAKYGDGNWYRAEIISAKNGRFEVVYADDQAKEWVAPSSIRKFTFEDSFPAGATVQARCAADDDKWRSGRVAKSWWGLHLIHFADDPRNLKSEWEAPERLRKPK